MKANAPKKIYLTKNLLGELFDGWDALPSNDFINIEYTRTDAFIEKAKKYLEERFINDVAVIAGGCVNTQFNQAFENFINHMKGE